jgi:hypothetical protein
MLHFYIEREVLTRVVKAWCGRVLMNTEGRIEASCSAERKGR